MKRWIKVNGTWIDTLEQQKAGYYYMIIDGVVRYFSDEIGTETEVGQLQDESDEMDEPVTVKPVEEPKKEPEPLPKIIYYLVVYLVGGCIDLKPFNTREGAKAFMEKLKYDMRVDKMKILVKDTATKWWKESGGYWL